MARYYPSSRSNKLLDYLDVDWKHVGGDMASKLLDYVGNYSIGGKSLGLGDWDYNDYRSMQRWESAPFIGRIAGARKQEMYNAENDRYWKEWARYNGVNLENIPYPIRSGIYGNYYGNTARAGFEATNSVINLYRRIK